MSSASIFHFQAGSTLSTARLHATQQNPKRRESSKRSGSKFGIGFSKRAKLELGYMAIVSYEAGSIGQITACEALAMPPNGMSCTEWVNQHVKNGVIDQFDLATLESALIDFKEQCLAVIAAGFAPSHQLAVNVHPRSLENPDYARLAYELADKYGVEPGRVIIEITEQRALRQEGIRQCNLLHEFGFLLYFDGYGSNHNRDNQICRVPVIGVKIDPETTCDLDENSNLKTRAAKWINRAKELGIIRIISEGSESQEKIYQPFDYGATHGQGWSFGGQKRTQKDFIALLIDNKTHPYEL